MDTYGPSPPKMCGTSFTGGVGAEIQKRLKQNGGTGPGSDVIIRAEVLKRVYDELLLDAKVDFQLQTELIDVEADNGAVNAAVLWGKSGLSYSMLIDQLIQCALERHADKKRNRTTQPVAPGPSQEPKTENNR